MLETKSVWESDSFKFRRDTFYDIGGECSVVGKEECSERLIVAWKRCSNAQNLNHYDENSKNDDVAVKIGLFDIKTTDIDVVFTSSEPLNIIHCTVDASLKTLAMVCETTPSYSFGFSDSSQLAEVTYSCYWTPLKISEDEFISVLPLNKESDHMMKVQLLSASHLLILNPREAIYLYTLPTCESIGYHSAMTSPVLYERLVGPFLWAEYNTSAGQLFYIHLKSYTQISDAHDNQTSTNRDNNRPNPILIGLQFHNGTVFETVLHTPIDLLLRIPSLSEKVELSNTSYKFNPLSNKIYNPVLKMEITMFTLPDGEVYICQGIIGPNNKDDCTINDEEMSNEIDVKYDISLLHHSCTLHCQVKGHLPTKVKNRKIIFVPMQGSMLVVMPGVFTHLLDIGLEHEPCNHVLLIGCALPSIGADEVTDVFLTSRYKKSFLYFICKPGEIKQLLVSVTNQSLLDTFTSAQVQGTTVPQAIIHQLLVHYCDVSNAEKLMKNLTVDSTEPHVVKLFQEFLLGGSFVHAKHHIDKKCCSLLPMSVAEPFHPQHEWYLDGKLQMTTTYTMMKNVKSVLLSPTERHVTHHKVVDLWFRLWQHLRVRSSAQVVASSRFSAKSMRDDLLAMGSNQMLRDPSLFFNPTSPFNFNSNTFCPLSCISQECSAHPATSFCRQFLGSVSSKKAETYSLPTKVMSYVDEDSEGVCGDGYSRIEQIVSLNLREITSHLTKHLPAAPATVIKECATFYVADCLDQSQVLCHIIFQLANIKSTVQDVDHDLFVFLNNLTSSGARTLFSWLERYLVAAEELVFPLPKGFEAFFSVLAYKCLNIRMFLHYVDFGVVQLNTEVLRCITADAKAVVKTMPQSQLKDDNVMVEIISRLPKSAAIQFLQHLKCHTTRLLQVHNIVERYCNHQCTSKNKCVNACAEMESLTSSEGGHYEPDQAQDRLEHTNLSSDSESDEEFNYRACESETLDLPTPIITAMTSFMCFLQEGDFYCNLFATPNKSKSKPKMISRVPCASAADMKFIKETQLRSIVSEGSLQPRSHCSKIPPVVYWR